MTTNQVRREAAKRKLAHQQQRRAQQAERRRRVTLVTVVAVVVVVLVGVVLASTLGGGGTTSEQAAPPPPPPAAPASGECAFTPTPAEPAAKPAPVPAATTASTTGTAAVALQTDRGPIPLTLDRSTGPCAVESFLSLTAAGYFDGTPCHRLTTGEGLRVLQCGDPTGTGTGGPGYTINDEPPTGLAPAGGGAGSVYPRGTVAMAKTAAPDSGGSQFFLVYADSVLPPEYTVFGTVGEPGLATLDAIAQGGTNDANGPGDGAPVTPVTIRTATAG